MTTATKLPAVLCNERNAGNSISMERALNQIRSLIEYLEPVSAIDSDRINASLDDIDTMLAAIDRS